MNIHTEREILFYLEDTYLQYVTAYSKHILLVINGLRSLIIDQWPAVIDYCLRSLINGLRSMSTIFKYIWRCCSRYLIWKPICWGQVQLIIFVFNRSVSGTKIVESTLQIQGGSKGATFHLLSNRAYSMDMETPITHSTAPYVCQRDY